MSSTADRETDVDNARQPAAERSSTAEPVDRRPLRLWWPTLLLVVYWVVVEGGYRIEIGMFPRFLSRTIALLVLMLLFLVWGMSRRRFSWKQRLTALAIIVGGTIFAGILGDESIDIFASAMTGIPIVLTLATAWLWLTRGRSNGLQLAGAGAAAVVVFGIISLLRFDGLDGRQRAQFSWRWTPSAEEVFLGSLDKATGDADPEGTGTAAAIEVGEDDWASFRGGDHESVVADVTLGDWNRSQPAEMWRKRVGPGWGSVLAIGDVVITQEQRGDQEAIVCYGANDGSEVWVSTSEARFEEALSGTGPRATPTAFGDKVVAYGAKGRLECLDLATGERHWSRNVLEESGAAVPMWGLSVSPLVVDDLVVVFAGGKDDQGLLAFELATGEPVWQTAAGTMTYSSPQVVTIAGVRQIVMQDEQALYGVEIATGDRLWSHPSPNAASFQPMIQPHLVDDDQLIVGWGSGILKLEVQRDGDSWKVTERWESNRLKPGFNDLIVSDGYIYGLDDGILCCVDFKDGKRVWKAGRYGFGQLLLMELQRELLILTEKGEVVRVAATPEEHRETGRFKAIDGKTWNHPVIAHHRLVVRNGEEMACFALTDVAVAARNEKQSH